MTPKPKKLATKTIPLKQSDNEEDLQHMISEAAYYRAENRGFEPENDLEDWLEAEKQIKEMVEEA